MLKISSIFLSFLISLSIAHGCGGTLGGNPEVEGSTLTSGVEFSIMDAPIEDAKNVYITVESLSLLQADGGWLNIPLKTTNEIDLLHYQNGLTAPLAELSNIAEGSYAQTRLILSESSPARLIDQSGVEHSLKVPSGSESGLKINSPLTVKDGVLKSMVIDFDLRKSIKLAGNGNNQNSKYILKPVLRLIDKGNAGTLSGNARDGDVLCLYASGTAKDNADDCENAFATGKIFDASFKLVYIPAGSYDIRVFKDGAVLKDLNAISVKANEISAIPDL